MLTSITVKPFIWASSSIEILNGDYKPENNDDSQELFKQKQYFMYSVFNKVLQSDMGKTIARKYVPTLMHNHYGGILGLTCPDH